MNNLGLIDIGGTSIKFAIWRNNELEKLPAVMTPDNLEGFYEVLTSAVEKMKLEAQIVGVGISSPGAVDKTIGVIRGVSAVKYLHDFDILSVLTEKFGLPVSLENDANCAALAELDAGAGRGVASLIFLILGTGVGGSVIVDHQIWHGAHLFGGEFGLMLIDGYKTLSNLGTAVNAAARYNAVNGTQCSGKEVFALAKSGDTSAQREVQTMYQALAKGIFNLQYSFDPERIVIGGAVSNNPDLIPAIEDEIDKLRDVTGITSVKPELVTCEFTDGANLRGAMVDFYQTFE
ncbi:ROK family protein [Companilactobacillus nodensis]|uniref:Sugar kinase and transcription regulator n=1 Tax=Companilactobacillus nodensis DSM 19682 = JCM 14932 = NBRC 107160 TaxID=1423775 RepID=A0A0R1KJU0_9LACO|nr:ROK family protein [Companilactobacillus nodensis]KRK81177.1 sugar kinase and transcription regulator [Companilactobacillus nodensis DSM 19682 = JCM 14932 = NBRC 107160]